MLSQITRWAEVRDDVRAAVLIGSRTRVDHPADAFSDIDILLFVRDPALLLDDASWPAELGDVGITFVEETPVAGISERRVLFRDGTDVNFAVGPVNLIPGLAAGGSDVLERGYRVLVNKDGSLAPALSTAAPAPVPSPPQEHELAETVSDFWYHAVWAARKLARGELFVAKGCIDGYMKDLLLSIVRWHAGDRDTWHGGRFLEEWADPRAISALRDAYARYDVADIRRALEVTMDLFSWLGRETASRLGYPYADAEETLARRLTLETLDAAR